VTLINKNFGSLNIFLFTNTE